MAISRQQDLNDDLGSYLNKRYGKGDASSRSFFKKVDSLIPKRKESEEVPTLDGVNASVYEDEHSDKKGLFQAFLDFFRSSKNEEELDEEIENLPEPVQEEVHELEEAIEEIDDEVDELEHKREGLFARLFGSLFGGSKKDDFIDEDQMGEVPVELDEHELLKKDTRAVLKSVHKWLSRLPPEQIDAFKRSPDFQRYKELLDKYGLIK